MDSRVILILLAEAAAALLFLYFSDVLRSPAQVVTSAALVVAAFAVRYACLDHVTLDYEYFLSQWVRFFRENGGFAALSQSVGNYNVPYLYFLAFFSYSGVNDLYLIKLLSIFFDVLLAFSAMKLASLFIRSPWRLLSCYFVVLLLPTVVLNGAYWGQCDSIYAAFAVMSLWLGLSDRPAASMICMAVSFAFKLQAVFLMPFMVVLWLSGRMKWYHFLLFPLTYLLLMLPAVALGRPLMDTITLYFNQLGSAGDGLNYNSPSLFGFFDGSEDGALWSKLGVAAAFVFMLAVFGITARRRGRMDDLTLLGVAALLCVGIPFLLPHMHDRYFFLADVVTVCLACAAPPLLAVPVLCQAASLNSYYAYLRQRFLLLMPVGASAMLAALAILIVFTLSRRQTSGRRRT